ncbi:xanthine dehydrogenase accessory factor [Rhodovulum bhavnagarense]|uniref:Xanthine dehydrogenase accessory factor n=1 Tax=Rhodovulum bhavnagarense TaxID=992286 RepID=A0A4R2RGH7_9RHOB|nr:XdhC/CoxI family protein [Rhodovulum bhavnagarense]TCP61834.1 xanthine dehydrogenase accessory factor [Rhodovulum bhavnagarense]
MRQSDHDAIPEIALAWHRAGQGAVLATVVETWGSAPRGVGSQLAVSGAGDMAGSVSGGCVEGAVVAEAVEALADGRLRLLEFGVSDQDAFAVGLACGGRIRVLVEPVGVVLPEPILAALVEARAARRAIAYLVDPAGGARRLAGPEDEALGTAIAQRMRADQSGFEGDCFVHVHNPPLRLAVVGAVHIAQTLVPMARLAGLVPTLIDPRPAFASDVRFPGESILEDWPDAALAAHGLDARSAVVTLTHDPKLDDPAILAALGSEVFYLGCLGSRRTHAGRVARLREAGVAPERIARIHAPVGLDIGARTPAEIAVSILAEIVERQRKG